MAFGGLAGGGGGVSAEGLDVEAFGGYGGGILEDEWGDAVGFGADEEGSLHDGGVVDVIGEVEGFGSGSHADLFGERDGSADAEIDAGGVGQAEGVAAYGGEIDGAAGTVDGLVSSGEACATEDVEAVGAAAGFGEYGRDGPVAGGDAEPVGFCAEGGLPDGGSENLVRQV